MKTNLILFLRSIKFCDCTIFSNIENSALTARTTQVSNLFRSPCLCTSASILDQELVFTSVSPIHICIFNSSLNSTSAPSQILVKYGSKLLMVATKNFIYADFHCLHTLYAQSSRITLAPTVLPRLLARC